jgi:hypothetical protein
MAVDKLLSDSIMEKYFSLVSKVDGGYLTPCHTWKGPLSPANKPILRLPGVLYGLNVSRFTWLLEWDRVSIPGSRWIYKACITPNCVAGQHYFCYKPGMVSWVVPLRRNVNLVSCISRTGDLDWKLLTPLIEEYKKTKIKFRPNPVDFFALHDVEAAAEVPIEVPPSTGAIDFGFNQLPSFPSLKKDRLGGSGFFKL